MKEEKLRGKPSFEHLNDPLHVLIEADLPVNVVDLRLRHAQQIIEELLHPVVLYQSQSLPISFCIEEPKWISRQLVYGSYIYIFHGNKMDFH